MNKVLSTYSSTNTLYKKQSLITLGSRFLIVNLISYIYANCLEKHFFLIIHRCFILLFYPTRCNFLSLFPSNFLAIPTVWWFKLLCILQTLCAAGIFYPGTITTSVFKVPFEKHLNDLYAAKNYTSCKFNKTNKP